MNVHPVTFGKLPTMKTGQTIRILRTARGISQGALARCLEVTPGYLSLVEQDKREPSLGVLKKVAKYFEVPAGFLLLGEAGLGFANPDHKRLIREIQRSMLEYVISRPDNVRKKGRSAIVA
jgi:transcriptional regulator with XRE-family HTH domain